MKITGGATLNAPRSAVWSALQDPAVLVRTIPGCHQLEATGDNAYRMTLSAGVASIRGIYIGDVRLTDQDPQNGYTLVASGQGAPGTIQAEARVRLLDGDGGGTVLSYDADAVVGGMIGGVGQRVLAGVAKKTAGEFFSAVDRYLAMGAVPAAETAAGAPPPPAIAPPSARPAEVPAGTVYRAPVPVPGGGRDLAIGAVLGAAIALAGVVIGVLAGRRR
jgi:uncharacterized protein